VRLSGRFDAIAVSTGDGPVEAEALTGSTVTEEWRLITGDGPVVLRLPSDFSADLDVHTGDGRITTDLPVRVVGSFGGRTLRGQLKGGGGRVVLRTGDGSIRLEAR